MARSRVLSSACVVDTPADVVVDDGMSSSLLSSMVVVSTSSLPLVLVEVLFVGDIVEVNTELAVVVVAGVAVTVGEVVAVVVVEAAVVVPISSPSSFAKLHVNCLFGTRTSLPPSTPKSFSM